MGVVMSIRTNHTTELFQRDRFQRDRYEGKHTGLDPTRLEQVSSTAS